MNEETKNIVVGVATLAVLIGLAALSFSPSAVKPTAGYTIYGTFSRVDGVAVGDDVLLSGVKVGEVRSMTLVDNYRANLAMVLDGHVKVPTDTGARVLTDGLFGSKYIELTPGGDEKNLQPGDKIGFTQGSLVLQDLLDQIIAQGHANRAKSATEKRDGK